MSRILLDTNVVSEMRKPTSRRCASFNCWAEGVDQMNASLSVVTITEIERGINLLRLKDVAQASVLSRWLEDRVLPGFLWPYPASKPRGCS
jgi:predicted nucleic acid-binding protein